MSDRTKTLWIPALLSLTGSMVWRLILQRSFPPSQPLLNHAGLPLNYQLIWLAALPLVGAASAYLSLRAGGNRASRVTAALAPSIVMIPLWAALATRMSHPSPRQWFGLLCGVLNWIVVPGAALLLGRVCFSESSTWKVRREQTEPFDDERTNTDVLDTCAGQTDCGDVVSDGLNNGRPAISKCGDGFGNADRLRPMANHAAVLRRRWSSFVWSRWG